MAQLEIQYPDELLDTLNETPESFEALARLALALKLYEMGKLSSGIASKLLGISRVQFLNILGQHNISYFDEDMVNRLEEEASYS